MPDKDLTDDAKAALQRAHGEEVPVTPVCCALAEPDANFCTTCGRKLNRQ